MGKRITKNNFVAIFIIMLLLLPSIAVGETCSDADLDGYGNPGNATCTNGDMPDCDDSDNSVHPGATEDCTDGIDNDCDGDIDYLDAQCAQSYRFERMWPTLQQPWYYVEPTDIALSPNGFIYVVDSWNDRIHKINTNGVFITKWGTFGTGDGELDAPMGVAVDSTGFVYVTDNGNDRVQKFTPDGEFIAKWGSFGTGDGEMNAPMGIAVDSTGFVYVADEGNHRIQKFSPDGQFITNWGGYGAGNGKFKCPTGVAVDEAGFVYVADFDNNRIQKFSSDGTFISKWGGPGNGDGDFNSPFDISVDTDGFVYVTDYNNNRIQKFNSDGAFIRKWGSQGSGDGKFKYPYGIAAGSDYLYVTDFDNKRVQKFSHEGAFITKWGSIGSGKGEFNYPYGITVDSNDNIYVTDDGNHRVQKFSPDGVFIKEWGSYGTGNGQFKCPSGITADNSGNIYVVDYSNYRVQKFDTEGVFIKAWGSFGYSDGMFNNAYGIAVDNSGFVYVADTGNHRIQKFDSEGVFIKAWGSFGSGDGDFSSPHDIAIDMSGNIYVADDGNHRIQKFDSEGVFFTAWGSFGNGDGDFDRPWGVAVDNSGFVYVVDGYNRRTQKFTPSGQFVTKWGNEIGGSDFFSFPSSLAVSSTGNVYIADVSDNRVQVFSQVSPGINNKAIIVAAGGPYEGNHLWDATQISANLAYQTLTYQGFGKDSIYYMTSDTDLDIDNNGLNDDVDSNVTIASLENAITTWAADADTLVLYIVDHGGKGKLRMNDTEMLLAADLDIWLDTAQASITGKVIVVYDACESGTFLPTLTPPAGKERIVISSTSPDESAYFVSQGSISFSSFFWTNIFNGKHIKDSFDMATGALSHTISTQTPLLDDNGNGTGNEPADGTLAQNTHIGNAAHASGNIPVIGSVSADQTIHNTISATLSAYDVMDNDGIARVWAVIIPPGFTLGASDNPVQGLPSVDLLQVGENSFEAIYNQFTIAGTYQIAIYALDRLGNTSLPKLTTVSVGSPLRRKAIIVAGGDQTDATWNATEKGALSAYNALLFQGYTDDDIYYLSPVTTSQGVDGQPDTGILSYAINTWASNSTWDLVLYMIGNGGDGTFRIKNTETLSANDLDIWLDNLQNILTEKVTVVYDAGKSGSFLPLLTPPENRERIVIASSDRNEPAYFLSEGDISFSRYFWIRILNGLNVRDAFISARQAMSFTSRLKQNAQLDDNGNGTGNEIGDGVISRNHTIGVGIQLAGNDPLIKSVVADQVLQGSDSTTIWADGVTSTGTIDRVWAVITPPGYDTGLTGQTVSDLPELILTNTIGSRFEGIYNDFSNFGRYHITIYAMDIHGNISTVQETSLQRIDAPDIYEDDDSYNQANVITLNNPAPQQHNFHAAGDEDWVKFYGQADKTYEIRTSNLGSQNDSVIELYDVDGSTLLARQNNPDAHADEVLSWTFTEDGIYYVKIIQSNPSVFGQDTEYDLDVFVPTMPPVFGLLAGTVMNESDGVPLSDVPITTSYGLSDISRADGVYIIYHPSGSYTVSANKTGYYTYQSSFTIYGSETVTKNIPMTPLCTDNDDDGYGNPGSSGCTNGSSLDCNDNNNSIHPGAVEVCDSIDNDCDTLIDDSDPEVTGQSTWYPDNDHDSYGNGSISVQLCSQASGYVTDNTDCNDSDAWIYPGSPPVRILNTTPAYFSTLQDAYDAASEGEVIQSKSVHIMQNILFDAGKSVSFHGGYDCSYSDQAGTTIISGAVVNSSGTIMLENYLLE